MQGTRKNGKVEKEENKKQEEVEEKKRDSKKQRRDGKMNEITHETLTERNKQTERER
jgi:hypothetical protein